MCIRDSLTLDAKDALGVDANFIDQGRVPMIVNFIDSLSFPFPECE